jgi:hypothetical protein
MKTIHRIKNRGPNKLVSSAKLILRGVSPPSFGFAFDYCLYYSSLNQSQSLVRTSSYKLSSELIPSFMK